jgi:P-type Ca2+ transporter type 2C
MSGKVPDHLVDQDALVRSSPDKVYGLLGSAQGGLTKEEAGKRLQHYGRNKIEKERHFALPAKTVHSLRDPFTILLVFAGLLALYSGITELAAVIFIIVILNTFLSIFQEWRAGKAMDALQKWVPGLTKVIRGGSLQQLPVEEVAPGDVLQLEEGDRVPADARLVETFDLWVNNVPLTGESVPRPRDPSPFTKKASSSESPNLIFMGTTVVGGRCKAVVYATGMSTKFGEIAALTGAVRPSASPLQKEISRAAKFDFFIALAVGLSFFAVGTAFLHLGLSSSVLLMIGVMVACVPEGLQLTISTALAISLLEMAKKNVLVKKLSAVQTLGSVTVICTDKTGTITKGEMTVSEIWVDERTIDISGVGFAPAGRATVDGKELVLPDVTDLPLLIELGVLCNNAKLLPPEGAKKEWSLLGDPTEGSILVAAVKLGFDPTSIINKRPRTGMLPFSSITKRMATFHRVDGGTLVSVKGSPGTVLPLCTAILNNGNIEPLDEHQREDIVSHEDELSDRGLRIMAIAYRSAPGSLAPEEASERDLIFVGLVGLKDPPRPEVKESVRLARRAGIRTVIVTGDYGLTAAAIAKEVGIVQSDGYRVINGDDLGKMDDEALSKALEGTPLIFARVTPPQKMRIVRAFKARGEVVAVTGDGANDAPSLREADIGVAMGASGTDVAREAADMILLDDSYASIVRSVELGRGVYDNVRKFIVYVFSHNWAELVPYLIYGLLAIPLPLLAVQILAIDLIIDVPPSLALSREPPEPGVMDRPPRSKRERLFNTDFLVRSVIIGLIIATGALIGCIVVWSNGGWQLGMQLPSDSLVYRQGTTMVFAGIVVAQMANLLGTRMLDQSILRMRWTTNKWIWISLAWMVVTVLAIVYLPPLQSIFGTAPLDGPQWFALVLLAGAVLVSDELMKAIIRKRRRSLPMKRTPK